MRSTFLSRNSWRGRSSSQLSGIEIEIELSNCFSINLLVVNDFIYTPFTLETSKTQRSDRHLDNKHVLKKSDEWNESAKILTNV